MSYIEGIGDELLIVAAVFLLLILVSLVWLSTSVIEPRISVIVVDAQRFQEILNRVRNAGIRIINLNRNLNNQEDNSEQGRNTATNEENVSNETSSNENIADTAPGTSTEKENTEPPHKHCSENECISDNDKEQSDGNASTAEIVSQSSDKEISASHKSDIYVKQASSVTGTSNHNENSTELNTQDNILSNATDAGSSDHIESTGSQITCDNKNIGSVANTINVNSKQSSQTETSHQTESSLVGSQPSAEDDLTDSSTVLPDGRIRIKLKYLDDRQKMVQACPQQTIGEFKRNHFAGELAENLMVRLIHNGQELRPDTKPLQAYNIKDSSVIHCLLSQNNQQNTNVTNHTQIEDEDYNIGTYIFPLFGIILGLIWYSRFSYGRYFNAISTLSLVGITFMYIIALLATLRSRDDNLELHEHED